MKPFLASSKSRLSSNGSVAEMPLRSSIVYVDGRLPFGSKCLTGARRRPDGGALGLGRGDQARGHRQGQRVTRMDTEKRHCMLLRWVCVEG